MNNLGANMKSGAIIKKLRTEKGLSQTEFAQLMNISNSALSQYEAGHRNMKIEIASKIADFFGITLDYLYDRRINLKYPDVKRPTPSTLMTPVVGIIRAGDPIPAYEDMLNYSSYETVSIPAELPGGASEYFGLRVVGDSMNLEGIIDGQTVIVHKRNIVNNGDIAVVLIDNEDATVKHFYCKDSIVTLVPHSSNPMHTPRTLDLSKVTVKILGKVVHASSQFR